MEKLNRDEIARYSRHLILSDIGMEGQLKLKQSSVLCVGAGGLGSPLLMYLAAAGVGRIGIVDPDRVDESNLHRQIIHGQSTVGNAKVDSAEEQMREINPHIKIEKFEYSLDEGNALDIVSDYDVVVDGSDNFPTRYLVNDACEILGKPNIYGSIFGFEGQASVFNYKGGPTYRDLYPEPPPADLVPNCAEGGVLGVLPGMIGMVQATETLKVLLGLGECLSGRLLLYDAKKMSFREIRFKKDEKRKRVTELINYPQFCGVQKPINSELQLSVKEAKKKLDLGWSPFVLDIRQVHESDIVKLAFTDRLCPLKELESIKGELPKDRDILVYCRSGARSSEACELLSKSGFRVFNLSGGLLEWAEKIDPSMPTY